MSFLALHPACRHQHLRIDGLIFAYSPPSLRLDNDNTIKPRFDTEKNKLTCAWVRKLDQRYDWMSFSCRLLGEVVGGLEAYATQSPPTCARLRTNVLLCTHPSSTATVNFDPKKGVDIEFESNDDNNWLAAEVRGTPPYHVVLGIENMHHQVIVRHSLLDSILCSSNCFRANSVYISDLILLHILARQDFELEGGVL